MNYFTEEKILIDVPKKSKGAITLAITFPNNYMIGMSSLGFQNAWKLLNSEEELKAIRWFTDAKEEDIPCPNYLGFSLSWELDYTNIFEILEKENIPINSNERNENHPLVFAGGQVINANPEPFCKNFDFFLLGDLEEVAKPLVKKLVEIDSLSREEKLKELSKLDGVYIPNLKEQTIKKPTTKESLSHSTILSPSSYWKDTFLVEIVRSCPELCRFCLASYGSLPFRTPDSQSSLIPIIDLGLKHTHKIGLLGASVTQHPEFMDILDYLLLKNKSTKLNVQIASVRADTIEEKLVKGLHELGSKSLTIAIESGSEKLREIINKKVSNETIVKSINTIYENGINSVKLYGMVGLPKEEWSDLDETIKLLKTIKEKNKGKHLSWGCSVFVPKASTPFQYFGVDKEADKKLKYLKKELHKIGVELRPESYKWSLIQALISRGNRDINKILYSAYKSGASFGNFKKAMKESDVDTEKIIHGIYDLGFPLPWEHLQGHLNKDIIRDHSLSVMSS